MRQGFVNTFRGRSIKTPRLGEHAWRSIAVDAQKNSGKNVKLLNIHMQRIDFPGESHAHIACRSPFFLFMLKSLKPCLACIHRII